VSQIPVSLIITTFNWPEALDLALQSVLKQNHKPAQVIVADDGSKTSTRLVIQRYKKILPIELVWQPDTDFRAARVRNLATLRANYKYLIFTDGDCLLPPNFVLSHYQLARRGKIVAGSRVLLNEQETNNLIYDKKKIDKQLFSKWKYGNLPLGILRDLKPNSWQTVRSCNFGVHRADMLKIRGFNEEYVGWGREDSDFVVRLIKSGVTVKSGRLAACVAHLYHQEQSRSLLSDNDARFSETLKTNDNAQTSRSTLGEV